MSKLFVALTMSFFKLTLASLEENSRLRRRRSIGKPLAKVLLKKGIEKGVKLGAAHFKTLREAAVKEVTSGNYLTKSFIDLIYFPQVLAIKSQIDELRHYLNTELTTRASYVLAMIILSTSVPLLFLFSTLAIIFLNNRLKKLKGNLL